MSQDDRIFIECPYTEKDEAKAVGAKWDTTEKKWYIPSHRVHQIELFNKWQPNGKIYLKCHYNDREKVKKEGARWDGSVKKWFYFPGSAKDEDFTQWLPPFGNDKTPKTPTKKKVKEEVSSSRKLKQEKKDVEEVPSSRKVKQEPSNTKTKKVKQDPSRSVHTPSKVASSPKSLQVTQSPLPRAYEDAINTSQFEEPGTIARSCDPSCLPNNFVINTSVTISQGQISNDNATRKRNALDMIEPRDSITSNRTSGKKQKGYKASGINLRILPRIKATLTIAQLNHELYHRDPHIKGTSNKNKQWFLDNLGIGSVWMTSDAAKVLDLDDTPRVSSAMTIAQLSHELLERIPGQTGISKKNKDWYLERLCCGTIWITSSE